MIPEQRQEIIRILQRGEELSPEWARILFPPEKREYELVYHGKERVEDILADSLAVPLQAVRTWREDGRDHRLLVDIQTNDCATIVHEPAPPYVDRLPSPMLGSNPRYYAGRRLVHYI